MKQLEHHTLYFTHETKIQHERIITREIIIKMNNLLSANFEMFDLTNSMVQYNQHKNIDLLSKPAFHSFECFANQQSMSRFL